MATVQVGGQKVFGAMLVVTRSLSVTPEVNLKNSVQGRKHASKKSTLALKLRADITRSQKQRISAPHKKDTNILKKRKDIALSPNNQM